MILFNYSNKKIFKLKKLDLIIFVLIDFLQFFLDKKFF